MLDLNKKMNDQESEGLSVLLNFYGKEKTDEFNNVRTVSKAVIDIKVADAEKSFFFKAIRSCQIDV